MPLENLKINTNTREADGYAAHIRDVGDAGLLEFWGRWVALGGFKKPTQEAQVVVWAEWIRAGRADALRTQVQHIIESGAYAHPFSALKKRMSDALDTDHAAALRGAPGGSPPPPSLRPGQRVRYLDGTEATVVSVLSRGIATDHPTLPDVPIGRLKTLEVLT